MSKLTTSNSNCFFNSPFLIAVAFFSYSFLNMDLRENLFAFSLLISSFKDTIDACAAFFFSSTAFLSASA